MALLRASLRLGMGFPSVANGGREMGKPFVCRLGIAQLPVNPAYADHAVSAIQEPVFLDTSEKVGLFTLARIEQINQLRQRVSSQYVNHLNHRLDVRSVSN